MLQHSHALSLRARQSGWLKLHGIASEATLEVNTAAKAGQMAAASPKSARLPATTAPDADGPPPPPLPAEDEDEDDGEEEAAAAAAAAEQESAAADGGTEETFHDAEEKDTAFSASDDHALWCGGGGGGGEREDSRHSEPQRPHSPDGAYVCVRVCVGGGRRRRTERGREM